jgi:hypothetical protein
MERELEDHAAPESHLGLGIGKQREIHPQRLEWKMGRGLVFRGMGRKGEHSSHLVKVVGSSRHGLQVGPGPSKMVEWGNEGKRSRARNPACRALECGGEISILLERLDAVFCGMERTASFQTKKAFLLSSGAKGTPL